MSEAFTPLSVGEAIAAAHRIFERADSALSLRRALDGGVTDREMISIVILARQLDEIAQAAADHFANGDDVRARERLRQMLSLSGYLPLETSPAEEPAHGAS